MSEPMRHTINSFLYRTGTPSSKVLLVMATNTPDMLDEAVHDRIDEIVAFDRPSQAERKNMLYHYLVKYCTPPNTFAEKAKFAYEHPRSLYKGKKLIRMENVDHEFIEEISKQTEGFSGREITKMVIAWHDAAFAQVDPVLTKDLMTKILKKFHIQHKLKETWTKQEAKMMEKMIGVEGDDLERKLQGSATDRKETSQEMKAAQKELQE